MKLISFVKEIEKSLLLEYISTWNSIFKIYHENHEKYRRVLWVSLRNESFYTKFCLIVSWNWFQLEIPLLNRSETYKRVLGWVSIRNESFNFSLIVQLFNFINVPISLSIIFSNITFTWFPKRIEYHFPIPRIEKSRSLNRISTRNSTSKIYHMKNTIKNEVLARVFLIFLTFINFKSYNNS